MSGVKISQLSAATALDGTELTPLVQAGVTKAATVSQLAASVLATVFIGASVTVTKYAALPAAASYTGKFAWVLNSTGILLTKKASGWYLSDGATWSPADPPASSASGITVDTTGFIHSSHADAQNVLQDLDAAIATGVTPGGSDTQVQFNDSGAFGGNANFMWNNASNSFTANTFGGVSEFGDATYNGNGTSLIVDDLNQQVSINANIGFQIQGGFAGGATNGIAVGLYAFATNYNSIAFGGYDINGYPGAQSGGISAVAFGNACYALGDYSLSIGAFSESLGNYSVGIGGGIANTDNSIAVGGGANTNGNGAICFASTNVSANAVADNSIVIGGGLVGSSGAGALTLGNYASVNAAHAGAFAFTATTSHATITGAGSLGLIFQDQHARTLSAPNLMMVLGASLLVDPSTGGSTNIAAARGTADFGYGTDAILIPAGTSSQQPGQSGQPAAVNGMIRYDTTSNSFQGYINGAWKIFTLT